jgi:hypothetical protein
MKKVFLLAAGFVSVVAVLTAQDHNNLNEKAAKDVIAFSSNVWVGTGLLMAGEYRVVCDKRKVTFTRLVAARDQEFMNGLDPVTRQHAVSPKKWLEVECKGRELSEPSKATRAETKVDPDGFRYLDKLYLRGSTVEHVFH